MTLIGPSDRQTEFEDYILKIKKGLTVSRYETKRRRKDGSLVDVSVAISPIKNEQGEIIGISAIDRDITGQKQAAQYARSLIEASLDPLVTISPEGTITDVNEASIKVTGIPREKLIDTDFSNYFTEPEKAREGYQQVLKNGEVRDYPLTIRNADGKSLTDVLYNASVYKDDKGNVLGVFAAARDYTRVKQTTDKVEATNKELEAFSYSVSHDLRAPLRAIDGFAKMLVDGYANKLDTEGKRIIGVIETNAIQMGKLIDDLLSFSRLGRNEMKKEYVKMGLMVKEIFTAQKAQVPQRNIELIMHDLPDTRVDPNMIRVVWTNLLSNAIKFTNKKEKAVIEVSSKVENNNIIFSIKDNGAGFDMKFADKLFGVFQRLHTVEEFEGTGVGLANVKRIIERHDGKVWAEGKVGEGATLYFSLPKV